MGINKKTGKILIRIDKNYYRPAEVNILQGDASNAKRELNWEPKWDLRKTIYETVKWYKDVNKGESPYKCIIENIKSFLST